MDPPGEEPPAVETVDSKALEIESIHENSNEMTLSDLSKTVPLVSPSRGIPLEASPPNKEKDYRTLCHELRRRLIRQSETNGQKLGKAMSDYETLNNKQQTIGNT